MSVVAIHVGAVEGEPLQAVRSAQVVAGKGLVGDRHFHADGAPAGRALTLVEQEEVESVGLAEGATRRQLTVQGIRLNDLVGRHFRVGDVVCYGVKLCEPCGHLQKLTRPGIVHELAHRAGINADILTDGLIAVGDAVVELEEGAYAVPTSAADSQS